MALPSRVAVLYGGPSSEREISCLSTKSVTGALDELGVDYQTIDIIEPNWMELLKAYHPEFVFLGLHGCPGEDGTVQGALELMGYPYQGSGVLSSSLAMHKPTAKKVFAASHIDVAAEAVYAWNALPENAEALCVDFPVVVKPVSGGSSVGIYIVEDAVGWSDVRSKVMQAKEEIMVEEYIAGREFTVAVMGDEALGVTEILSNDHAFYDFESKYTEGGSTHVCPADIPQELAEKMCEIALKAHHALDCRGITRSDLRYDSATGRLVILEVNTLPGMTNVSLVPELAAYKGYSFNQLITWMIEEAACPVQQTA